MDKMQLPKNNNLDILGLFLFTYILYLAYNYLTKSDGIMIVTALNLIGQFGLHWCVYNI